MTVNHWVGGSSPSRGATSSLQIKDNPRIINVQSERFRSRLAVFLILRDGDKVLLHRRQNTGYADGMYSLVGGHADGGESVTYAMAREAKEEAGIDINPSDLHFSHVVHRQAPDLPGEEYIDFYFMCNKWSGEVVNAEPHKCSDLSFFHMNELPSDMIPGVKSVLEKIEKNNNFYSEYNWYTSTS